MNLKTEKLESKTDRISGGRTLLFSRNQGKMHQEGMIRMIKWSMRIWKQMNVNTQSKVHKIREITTVLSKRTYGGL